MYTYIGGEYGHMCACVILIKEAIVSLEGKCELG